MNCTILLRKLIAIERMIGKAEDDTLRNLLMMPRIIWSRCRAPRVTAFFAKRCARERRDLSWSLNLRRAGSNRQASGQLFGYGSRE